MRILYVLVGLFLASSISLWAQDVGTQECGDAQEAAQDAVEMGGSFRNKGQRVRVAANVVGPLADSGEITEDCKGCILKQFAKGIPIDDQDSCGPLAPEPGFCDNPGDVITQCATGIPRCNEIGACSAQGGGVCLPIVDGSPPNIGFCLNPSAVCGDFDDCPDGDECSVGEFCVESCCVGTFMGRKCVTTAIQCLP